MRDEEWFEGRGVDERPRPRPTRLAWWIWALIIVTAIAGGLRAGTVRAEPIEFDCASLAHGMALMVDFRDTGASVEKVVRLLRRRSDHPAPYQAAIEREIRRLWREGLPADAAIAALYKRCQANLGDMGRDG